ncbi:DUF1992 domain-containing protein [Nocardioides sp. zg-579]|uniref:DUF1992 domain-containing protein n=1 Tax=Nocardioides marmotae TaxID=2663857 RepID=A0A6I3JFB8_9ACTN|nr:DUF1992 domain-containing protein [Nocardioides marmotae]MCR6033164.1 DUF1992 domain-containing protein [Gordonia jinghuaiqii]MTB96817.1 DUF1992 domain-containing protein [Nocardioides marmotae]QKE02980.1 DUF1992 domain-containing protein [Nocardioides marmotae]
MSDSPEQPRDTARSSEHSQAEDEAERRKRSGESAAHARIANQASWVDQQVRVAMAKGEFDDLPGAGKPIADLGTEHYPDWWIKRLVEREQIAVLPPSVALRKEDAELDDRLDTLAFEGDVRRELEDFNERVIRARYSLSPGPPLVTMPRDVDAALDAWRERRTARLDAQRAALAAARPAPRRRWWQRRRG